MSHPCQDHMATCDHCYSCEVLHVCCCASDSGLARVMAGPSDLDVMSEAVKEDAHSHLSLSDLIRADQRIRSITELIRTAERHEYEMPETPHPSVSLPALLAAASIAPEQKRATAQPALPAPRLSALDVLRNQKGQVQK